MRQHKGYKSERSSKDPQSFLFSSFPTSPHLHKRTKNHPLTPPQKPSQRLGFPMTAEELDAAFDEMDSSGDGRVTVEEFEKWWNGSGGDLHEKMHKEFTMGKDIESIREMGSGAMLG